MSLIKEREIARERQRIVAKLGRARTKVRCLHATMILEAVFMLAFLVLVELRFRFVSNLDFLGEHSQIMFYVLLIAFIARFFFFRVIKKDFNSIHSFMQTFTRIFLIVLSYTVTAKLDKDIDLARKHKVELQSKWLSAMWPFWIYIALYLILSLIALGTFFMTLGSYCTVILYPEEVNMKVLSHQNKKKASRWKLFSRRGKESREGGSVGKDLEVQVARYKAKRKINCKPSFIRV
jgi:hypothetical protein